MAAQGKTRSTIVDIANALLLTRGFSAFSYKHISEKLGIKNAAVHYHFASKEELGLLLVQQYRQQFADWLNETAPTAFEPLQALASICHSRLAYWQSGAQMSPECMLVAEYSNLPQSMQLELKKLIDDIATVLSTVLSSGRKSGVFVYHSIDEAGDYDRALLILAELNGVQQLARTGNIAISPETVERLCESITAH